MRVTLNSSRLRGLRAWAPLVVLFGVVGLALLACVSPPLESPSTNTGRVRTLYVPQNLKNKVDILFMVDNSNSMDAMQNELKNRFPQFFKPFQDLADKGTYADLNIGVVTSDYGAGSTGAPGCSPSPGGQMGKLQALGVKAAQSCQKPTGANFIHYAFVAAGMPDNNNLPKNQNLIDTFTCMASVGAMGCGFEHQLEAVYAALRNNLPENVGFLREDALLVVVFLTNEDDASAPPDTDIFDKNKTAQYGYEDSYSRQTRFGIMCGSPGVLPPYGDSGGPMAGCVAATNPPGKDYDISRYIQLFNSVPAQGGVKTNPLDVVLVGIDAPEDPFQVILSNPGTANGTPYQQCPQLNESSNPPCVPVLQHSCQNPQQPVFFGDPAIRINTVIRASKNNAISSICDSDYTTALDNAAKQIVSQLGGGCIPDRLPPDPANPGQFLTDCKIQDVTANPDGTQAQVEIPKCDPGNPGVYPCWKIEVKDKCEGNCANDPMTVCTTAAQCPGSTCTPGASPDGVGLTVDRNGQPAPDHTTATVSCATLAGQ